MSAGFRFKRFAIEQQRAAMKVGTDGVLLGAWARLEPKHKRILDVGCGTGLIALMAAQRSEEWGAEVWAVEIEQGAVEDARENFAASPWAGRLRVEHCSVQEFESEEKFDHLLSNPPYFVASLLSPDGARTAARHTTSLTFDELAIAAAGLLTEEGVLSVVLPTEAAGDMTLAAARRGLFLARRTDVCTKSAGKPLRSLLEYGFRPMPTELTQLTIHTPDGDFTEEYRALTGEFYLKF